MIVEVKAEQMNFRRRTCFGTHHVFLRVKMYKSKGVSMYVCEFLEISILMTGQGAVSLAHTWVLRSILSIPSNFTDPTTCHVYGFYV